MKTIKSIAAVSAIAISVFVFSPSTHEITHEMTVHNGSTINQMVMQAAEEQGIELNSVDLNESRDLTIHEGNLDAGNLRPGTQVKVVVVYRK